MPVFVPFRSDTQPWPKRILFGQIRFIILRGSRSCQPRQCLAVIPRHPLRWVARATRHAAPNLLQAYCWNAVNRWPAWSAWASLVSSCEVRGAMTTGHCHRRTRGARMLTVYSACTITAATPETAASGQSSARTLNQVPAGFDRPARCRLDTAAFSVTCTSLPPASLARWVYFSILDEGIARETPVVEPCFAQITTGAPGSICGVDAVDGATSFGTHVPENLGGVPLFLFSRGSMPASTALT